MKKIVFFDIDGTLVTEGNHAPESAKKAVTALKKNGALPVIATGRAPSMVWDICEEFGISSYIAMNGQYIVLEGEAVFANPLPPETVQTLIEDSRANNHGVFLCGSDEIYGNALFTMMYRSSFFQAIKGLGRYIPKSLTQFVVKRMGRRPISESKYADKDIYQVVLQMSEEKDDLYRKKFPHCHFTRSSPYSVDVIAKGVSKASGIHRVVDHLGMDMKDTVAFGDNLNDLEMLQTVEMGVAMGNARPEVKRVADAVTDSVDRDGIVKGLKQLQLI